MSNNHTLGQIHKKVDEIQLGLLRFKENDSQVSLQVTAKSTGDDCIECEISDAEQLSKLVPGKVNLIQKSDKNYLYISGEIQQPFTGNRKSFSIRVLRACWFVLKSKGAVSWLQEKFVFDKFTGEELEMAS